MKLKGSARKRLEEDRRYAYVRVFEAVKTTEMYHLTKSKSMCNNDIQCIT
jgi:hypothetical protein